ncbi:Hpt domain-containing protein [Paucibacter sp. APW11]|uniref:histidine kinase n=1 Tax=Roseateles aquae TaxID=3077235 RepID=A0ABU3PFR7_9BURK|nr:Hpt domain-containing protein [Paucibacter sp. APW11]MDT9001182.1 Hpt domain-containing protein [Paucibacter sp. APW11]
MDSLRDSEFPPDLSPLAWVQEELRRSLESVHKTLRRFLRDNEARTTLMMGGDAAPPNQLLTSAAAQIHQVSGVLSVVGLTAGAAVLRATELAVNRMAEAPLTLDLRAVELVERAHFALLSLIARMLAGNKVSSLALFPTYRELQAYNHAERVHPADLWQHQFSWRELPDDPSARPVRIEVARSAFEAALLKQMREPSGDHARQLSDLCAGLGLSASTRGARTLWRLAAAQFQAQALGLLKPDAYVKRLGSRLLSQMRASAGGDNQVSERLAQDLLFFCAQSAAPLSGQDAARLQAVRISYGLGSESGGDYEDDSLGRIDPAWVSHAKRRVSAAKESWSSAAEGESQRLAGLDEQFAGVSESLARLFPGGEVLGDAMQRAVVATLRSGQPPSPNLAMEIATSLLYIEAALDDAVFDHPEQGARVRALALRVAAVARGEPPEELESWMEDLYRRVSDRQTLGSVVHELRSSLSEVERQVDEYFRDPRKREVLIPVPNQLATMRGVLGVLGLDQAAQACVRMRDELDDLANTEVDPERAVPRELFERLANNLGAMGFLIDMLSVQPQLAKRMFAFDDSTGVLASVLRRQRQATLITPAANSLLSQVQAAAQAVAEGDRPAEDLARDLEHLALQARAADEPSLVAAAQSAQRLLDAGLAEAAESVEPLAVPSELPADLIDDQARAQAAQPLNEFIAARSPAAAEVPPPSAPIPHEDESLDEEMLGIFIEEAAEVIATAREALAQLAEDASLQSELTTVRRAFHTLKGSSRMVGLGEFGEAAWACEQLYNTLLAEQRNADSLLLGFSGEALDELAAWAEEIDAQGRSSRSANSLRERADALRLQGQWQPSGEALPALAVPAEASAVEVAAEALPESIESIELPLAEASPASAADLAEFSELRELNAAEAQDHGEAAELPALEAEVHEPHELHEPAHATVPMALDGLSQEQQLASVDEPISLDLAADDGLGLPELDALAALNAESAEAHSAEALPSLTLDDVLDAPLEATHGDAPEAGIELGQDLAAMQDTLALPVQSQGDAEPVLDLNLDADSLPDFELPLGLSTEADDTFTATVKQEAQPQHDEMLPTLDLTLDEPVAADVAQSAGEAGVELDLDLAAPAAAALDDATLDLGLPDQLEPAEAPAAAPAADALLDLSLPDELLAVAAAEPVSEADAELLAALMEPAAPEPQDAAEAGEAAEAPAALVEVAPDSQAETLAETAPEAEPEALDEPVAEAEVEPATEELLATVPETQETQAPAASDDEVVAELPEAESVEALQHDAPADDVDAADAIAALAAEAAPAAPHLSLVSGGAEAPADALDDELDDSEESVKVIGPLRISISLFNIFLNEADELSRRLNVDLAEWALAPAEPVPAGSEALAHALAGNAATVGYEDLSELARALEHALGRAAQAVACSDEEARLFVQASEDIRRLLHQFAAGFLKPAEEGLKERLQAYEPAARRDLAADSEFEPSTPSGRIGNVSAEDAEFITGQPNRIDAELFPIFEEEGRELLQELHARLREWLASPGDHSRADACMRTLHTFKGGARLTGAMRIGEQAHMLESAIEAALASGRAHADDVLALQHRGDALDAAFEDLLASLRADAAAQAQVAAAVPLAPVVPVASVEPLHSASELPVEALAEPSADAIAEPIAEPDAAAPLEPAALAEAAPVVEVPARQIDWARFDGQLTELEPAAIVGAQSLVRVRGAVLERMAAQAGEVSIRRARLESEMAQMRNALSDLDDNLERLRSQLRELELQAEAQMGSRQEAAKATGRDFDPLEFDRYTRFQELTRMMAESVNDVATVQRSLQRNVQLGEDELAGQSRLTRDLQDDLLRTRMVEFDSLAERMHRVVRQAARECGKQAQLEIAGGHVELDRSVLERMIGSFEHLLRNSVIHGIEMPEVRVAQGKNAMGTIFVRLTQEGNEVLMHFSDDGAGLDLPRIRERAIAQGLVDKDAQLSEEQLTQLIFAPGFSTATTVTELAGRGVGMDVVRSEVNTLGGYVETKSVTGMGTSFELRVPLTTALTQVVLLRYGEQSVAVPAHLMDSVLRLPLAQLEKGYADGELKLGDHTLPLYWLGGLMHQGEGHDPRGQLHGRTASVVLVRSAQQRLALHVDEVIGKQEVVVKNLGPQLISVPGLAGISLLATGDVALIYNPVALANRYGEPAREAARHSIVAVKQAAAAVGKGDPQAPLILVVDDSLTVRRVTQRLLEREGYRVQLAKDGLDAMERLAGDELPAVVLSDIEMPRMDGFDLVRNLRADPRLTKLPVIMITSRIAQKHRDYAHELGVDDYLGKPYDEELLLGLIGRYTAAAVASA